MHIELEWLFLAFGGFQWFYLVFLLLVGVSLLQKDNPPGTDGLEHRCDSLRGKEHVRFVSPLGWVEQKEFFSGWSGEKGFDFE